MDRYIFTEVTSSNSNDTPARSYESTYYPEFKPTQDDTYIHSRTGDRLDNLAFEYYGDTSLWWVIALVNNLGKGSLVVPVAIQLRIPSQSTINDLLPAIRTAQKEL
jgi:phage tail protein X